MKLLEKTTQEIKKFRDESYKRDGIYLPEQVQPVNFIRKDSRLRYSYFQMLSCVEYSLVGDVRRMKNIFDLSESSIYNGQRIPGVKYNTLRGDFWSEFQMDMFWADVRNSQTNRLYIGLDKKKIKKRLGREPSDEEMHIQKEFNTMFGHLAAANDWISIELWW